MTNRITEGLYYIGVQDPLLRVFDVVMEAPHGTSYNGYLLRGEKGIAVIEACKAGFEAQWIEKIKECADPKEITHIFLNHTEPDHAGALHALLDIAPNAKVYASRAANMNLSEILNREFPGVVIKGGESFDLGGVTLQVIDAPFLHWPDSLFLWCEQKRALFTCDVFGFHYSSESLYFGDCGRDAEMDRKYYFDVIFSPFVEYVKAALGKIRDLPIELLLTSHGPVYNTREDIGEALALYDRWSDEVLDAYRPEQVFVGYASSYGYTKRVAEEIARGVSDGGMTPVLHDIGADPFGGARIAANSGAIAIGSSTLNRDALPPVWTMLGELSAIRLRKRPAMVFGSYGWSGEAVPNLSARLAQLGLSLAPELRFKLRPTQENLQAAYEAGLNLVAADYA